ncbi:phage portal protein [Mameliella sediminis]|uniref:phage portal protein n=1 Tax=Mameliella sediminis TaxID=2836866 RepID=UPI001C484122|nr:phage portal protein [Mameliella sediminis]MBV7394564.1 phage portal protein [Mameliella sediminis]
MIRFLSAAMRGIRAELASAGGGWQVVSGQAAPLSGFGRKSDAGPVVSPETIMNLSTAWACTAANAQLVASLPCRVFEVSADGRRRRIEPEIEAITFRQPNATQTGVEFWEGMTAQQLIGGNAYARRLKVGRRTVGFEPLLDVTPKRVAGGFEYELREEGRRYRLKADEVLHLRGFGVGGGLGLSAVRYGTQSFGAALAAERSAARVFVNGMQPSAVLQSKDTLTEDQRAQLAAHLGRFAGSDKAGKAMVLEAGLEWKDVQWNPEDVQLLETRAFQVEEICRWFGTPPVVIGHAGKGQTMWGTGVEAIQLAWLRTGINPILKRNEARLNIDVIPPERRGKWFVEYDREAMLQMDSKAKGVYLSAMATSGTMSANERREVLGLEPHGDPQANALLAQTALAPLRDLTGREPGNGGE